MNKSDYIPVDCGFHDEIEAAIVLRDTGNVQYLDNQGDTIKLEDVRVVDWVNRNKEEFMVLSNGLEIRLDHITHFMGKNILGGYCVR